MKEYIINDKVEIPDFLKQMSKEELKAYIKQLEQEIFKYSNKEGD